jgi:cupredoxin-like protein
MGPLVLVVLLAAAGGSPSIVARDFAFDPVDLEVLPGAEVTFRNEGQAPHTATSRNQSFNAEAAAGQEAVFRAPQSVATYPYVCAYHDWMTGNLSVVAETEPTRGGDSSGTTPSMGFGVALFAGALAAAVWRRP